jgi:hypothetical protein
MLLKLKQTPQGFPTEQTKARDLQGLRLAPEALFLFSKDS